MHVQGSPREGPRQAALDDAFAGKPRALRLNAQSGRTMAPNSGVDRVARAEDPDGKHGGTVQHLPVSHKSGRKGILVGQLHVDGGSVVHVPPVLRLGRR